MTQVRQFKTFQVQDDYQQPESHISPATEELVVHDILLMIAKYMSVFDVPNLALVSKFFAANSELLWRDHTKKIFPEMDNPVLRFKWHDRFFRAYNSLADKRHVRRVLQITQGRTKSLIKEHQGDILMKASLSKFSNVDGLSKDLQKYYQLIYSLFGTRVTSGLSRLKKELKTYTLSIYSLFGLDFNYIKRDDGHIDEATMRDYSIYNKKESRDSLFALTHTLSDANERNQLLDFFYFEIILPYVGECRSVGNIDLLSYYCDYHREMLGMDEKPVQELRNLALELPNIIFLRHCLDNPELTIDDLNFLCAFIIKAQITEPSESPLVFAIKKYTVSEILHLLQLGCDVNVADKNGQTATRLLSEHVYSNLVSGFWAISGFPKFNYSSTVDDDQVYMSLRLVGLSELISYIHEHIPECYQLLINKVDAHPKSSLLHRKIEAMLLDEEIEHSSRMKIYT